jgi:hypothetical protein
MIEIAAALLAGAGRRLSGDSRFEKITGRGATTARLVCLAVPLGLLALLRVEWCAAACLGALVWAGATLPQRGQSLSGWVDAAYLLARGIGVGAVVAPLVWWLGGVWWLPALSGVCAPLAYWLGYRLWPRRATEVGEVGSYAAFGAALFGAMP